MAKFPKLLIDISNEAIKVLQVKQTKSGVEVLKAGSEHLGLPANASQEVVNQAIQETLPILLKKLGIKEKRAIVSIPGKAAFTRQIKIPVVRGKQLERIIKYEAKQQIPFPLDQVNFDYEVSDTGAEISELDVSLVAVRREVADGYATALKKCGIRADIIEAAPLAVYNAYAASNKRDADEVTAVVSIGKTSTDIAIEQDGRMQFIRSAAVAENTLAAMIAKKFGISIEEAEELKSKKAEDFGGDQEKAQEVAAVMEQGFERIITEIRRSFDFYVSQPESEPVSRIYLCGKTVEIEGVSDFLEEHLGVPVEMFQADDIEIVNISSEHEAILGYDAELIGMAVRSAGKAPCAMSFSPAHIKQRIELERRSPLLFAMLVLISLMIGGSYYFLDDYVQKQASAVNRMEEIVTPGLETLKPLKDARAKQDEYKKRIERINDVAEKRGELTRIFMEVQRLIPNDIWLDSIEMTSSRLDLKGRALSAESVSTYVRNLSMSPFFNNNAVQLRDSTIELDPVTGKPQNVFSITLLEYNDPTETEIKFVDEFRNLVSDDEVLIVEFERSNPSDPESEATLVVGCYDYDDNEGRMGFLRKVHKALADSGDTTVTKLDLRFHDFQSNLVNHYVVAREEADNLANRQLTSEMLWERMEAKTPQPTPRPTDTPTPGEESGDAVGGYGGGYGGMGYGGMGYGGMGYGGMGGM